MRLLDRIKISTKVFSGFGVVLFLLLLISTVSMFSLVGADRNLKSYRALARQTNAEGRVQANMLMTRLHAKDFIISANAENIEKIEERAQRTIEMLSEARELTTNPGYQPIIESVDRELDDYVTQFEKVTKLQARRDEIVHDTLNVVGPTMEKELTAIMQSAFEDDGREDAVADLKKIHQAGTHLLSLINEVLDLAKVESGKMEALAEDFEVESLIDEVSATAQPLVAKNANQLRIERGVGLGTAHQDLTSEEKRSLSGRVEQILDKDAWSHEQLVGLVHKLATGNEVAS